MSFELHPRLLADTAMLTDWKLSRVLLMNDANYPWLILVPRLANVSELFELDAAAQGLLMAEIARASAGLKIWAQDHGGCDKVNAAAIGNIVPQLHIHVVARRRSDPAWPGVVWGAGQAKPYEQARLADVIASLGATL